MHSCAKSHARIYSWLNRSRRRRRRCILLWWHSFVRACVCECVCVSCMPESQLRASKQHARNIAARAEHERTSSIQSALPSRVFMQYLHGCTPSGVIVLCVSVSVLCGRSVTVASVCIGTQIHTRTYVDPRRYVLSASLCGSLSLSHSIRGGPTQHTNGPQRGGIPCTELLSNVCGRERNNMFLMGSLSLVRLGRYPMPKFDAVLYARRLSAGKHRPGMVYVCL